MNTVIWKTCSIYFSTKKYNCMTRSCYWFSLVLSYIKFFIKHWLWPLFFLKCNSYYHSNSYFLLDRVKHWKASWIILKISNHRLHSSSSRMIPWIQIISNSQLSWILRWQWRDWKWMSSLIYLNIFWHMNLFFLLIFVCLTRILKL